ncbi:MAG: hypothetical protein FWE38_04845 [Firmicutes bacterium]|nr:hypothetical protein [Bacillota bacterium]
MVISAKEKSKVIESIVTAVQSKYDACHETLREIANKAKTGGEKRQATGDFVEQILQTIIDTIAKSIPEANLVSKRGSQDSLSMTLNYKGGKIVLNKIQVDRHLWARNKRIAFVENKTYLDACYLDRALADFKKIAMALEQEGTNPNSVKYIVFAGQDAVSESKVLAYEALFNEETKGLTIEGLKPHIFYFLQEKRRSSKELSVTKFLIDVGSVERFSEFIINLL